MARPPPSHYNRLFGAKVHSKGPASTRTLTTNTHTTTTGVSSVLHDPSVPRTYLFDIYKNEAESHFEIGEYRQAADCYNAAVKLQPSDTAAIIARSRCYAQMGRWKRAMKDCDAALSIDAAFGEALFQKAEILHVNGNLDLALVYFKRALKQHPESIRYKNGVQKAFDSIQKQNGAGAQKTSKLTAVGDLSMFLHSQVKSKRGGQAKDTPRLEDEDTKLELPSAGFRARFNVAPLIRINRKPGVSILRTYRPESAKSNSSADSANREPDESTMRIILGELYGDRKYLKKFQNNLPGGKAERDLTLLADEGLEFLRERTIFWDSLGPLPPPQMPKRSNMRERSFFMTNNDAPTANNNNSTTASTATISKGPGMQRSATYVKLPTLDEHQKTSISLKNDDNKNNSTDKSNNSNDINSRKNNTNKGSRNTNTHQQQQPANEPTGKRGPGASATVRRPRKKKRLEVAMGLERDYSDVDFKFRSLQPSRSASRMDETDPDFLPTLREIGRSKTRPGRTMFVGMDDPERDRKRQLTKFINKEMDIIDEAFKTGEFEDCRNKANVCLRTVAGLPGDDINKNEVVASLHSCIGNACIAMNDFDGALRHHMEALAIGETENLIEVVNRSLGHLGRMYIIQKRFNKALEVFARKAPTVVSAEEVAQVFHEIGNCFLALGHLDYARDCGKKALRAALEADIHYFKFQSWVLIAVSESRMKHHDEAYKAFDEALNLAKDKNDEESVNVILFAMEHLSKTITSIKRKREMLSERLMSRSKTQTILDLNKRPHAARVKKRKKRMRREGTNLDDEALTRQTTCVLVTEPESDNNKPSGRSHGDGDQTRSGENPEKVAGDETGSTTSPQLDYSRGTTMFEKSPRELEPFGDPTITSKKKQEKLAAVRVHSRHAALDRLGSGSRRGSWASGADEPSSRRGSNQELMRLEIPPSPAQMDESVSASRRASATTKLPPLKYDDGPGHHSDVNTPRADLSHDNVGATGDGGRDNKALVDSSYEDGFLSQREEYYSRSRTGGHNTHRGGFHSNRESRAECTDGELKSYHGKITPRDGGGGRDSTQRVMGARSRNKSRTMKGRVLDSSLEEHVGNGEEDGANGEEGGCDVTGVSSGMNSNWQGDLSSGRFGDLSNTMESSFRTPAVDDDLTPRGEGGQTAGGRHSMYGKTPGRFTRESYFDENETMDPTDGGASPEHVSVSRQHRVSKNSLISNNNNSSNKNNNNNNNNKRGGLKDQNEIAEGGVTPRAEKGGEGNNAPFPVERSASKVSLRGTTKKEDNVATFETSKPYRISSATSERKAKRGHAEDGDDKGQGQGENEKGEDTDSNNLNGKATPMRRPSNESEVIRSAAKSQASALTTGSGWDGDVSTETDVMPGAGLNKEARSSADVKPHGVKSEGEKEATKHHQERFDNHHQQQQKQQQQQQQQQLNMISENTKEMSSNDVTLNLQEGATTEESTVTSLRPRDVKEDVQKNTMDAPTEEKRLIMASKLAHLDQRHATKVWRESRDLEDIQSIPFSSRADLNAIGNPQIADDAKALPPESDPGNSVTLPVSVVSSNDEPEEE